MFERYLTDALTTHFGHVVENLDADKVRVSAWNGEVVLEDLSLRSNALESFLPECPVEIAYGTIGNLELRIPWKLLRSQLQWGKETDQASLLQMRCSIVLTDVTILITPKRKDSTNKKANSEQETSSDASLEERRTEKEKEVQSLLDANLLKRVAESSISSSRWSWVQDYLSSLLSTLSVTVRNIHVRYEDPGTCMGYVWSGSTGDNTTMQRYRPAFAVGITLRQFSIHTDEPDRLEGDEAEMEALIENGENGTSTTAVPEIAHQTHHKVAAAEKLAIYWDSHCQLMSVNIDNLSQRESRQAECKYYQSSFQVLNDGSSAQFSDESLYKQRHAYLLDPISPSINLTLVPKNSLKHEGALQPACSSDVDETSSELLSAIPNKELTPPSSVRLDLPPCKFTLSRSTLEDTAYIRKSLSVWLHATTGLLSESSLRRLARLRPLKSPRDDPRSWWIYASEATLAISRANRQGRDLEHLNFYKKRKRGWLGLVQALQRRQRYAKLYQSFLSNENGPDDSSQLEAHHALLEMEDELLPEEIVAFRISTYEAMRRTAVAEVISSSTKDEERLILSVDHRRWMMEEMIQALEREKTNVQNRVRDGARQDSIKKPPCNESDLLDSNPTVWKVSLVCREFGIQVNDEVAEGHRTAASRITPVIRMSSAWVQDQLWYQDGSWDADCSLASLAVKDLTGSKSKRLAALGYFTNLIGRKQGKVMSESDDSLFIDKIRYHRCLSINVRRRLDWKTSDGQILRSHVERGSTTRIEVRILPMEVVYSTLPVEALSRALASVKTPELVDDYHRMASAAHGWQQRQKQKFLQALAHKHKKILIDIDVGAPELLIPEDFNRPESPMLAVNLGRLQMFNEPSLAKGTSDFDDKWRLVLSNVQVRSTTIASYYSKEGIRYQSDSLESHSNRDILPRQLVEPFSLDFTVATKIASDDSEDTQDHSRIHVSATLPRLAFNLTSSAVRLVSRLREQWESRKREMLVRPAYFPVAGTFGSYPMALNSPRSRSRPHLSQDTAFEKQTIGAYEDNTIRRSLKFQFSAPVITLRLDNDVDGRDSNISGENEATKNTAPILTPLVDLAFRGIRGNVVQEVKGKGDSTTTFDAKLHSLGALDLYQNAGHDFALLMSSVPQEALVENLVSGEDFSWQSVHSNDTLEENLDSYIRKDLVSVEYTSKYKIAHSEAENDEGSQVADKLAIWFHELYVEWNPETLAAIHNAVQMPPKEDRGIQKPRIRNQAVDSGSDDEEFFDAMEDEFFDAGSETNSMVHLISEVSSSDDNAEPDHLQSAFNSSELNTSLQNSFSQSSIPLSPNLMIYSATSPLSQQRMTHSMLAPTSPVSFVGSPTRNLLDQEKKVSPFEVVFNLSKLRVSFNKETRHRKVMIAQMDGTSFSYATRVVGGSKTTMSIGNLVFIDPASEQNTTLYGQILGVKSKSEDYLEQAPSSLLEMEILINPKTKSFESNFDFFQEENSSQPVSIDRKRGIVVGCNTFVRARFSPMRFVFLEQLWFEFMDYFFEGVIGTEVWGGSRANDVIGKETPSALWSGRTSFLPGSDAEGFNFTRFDIYLESPELLLPVTYQSPHFMRLELTSIHVSNHYDSSIITDSPAQGEASDRMQWFNNCGISLQGLRLFSWCGRELGKAPVIADVALRWPSGPLAYRVVPKWTVTCIFNSLDVSLRRSDYALLQHILSFNIGEQSRHLDEWEALQTLAADEAKHYKTSIMVHYGYDKKDVAPTTYDLTVTIPSVSFSLIEADRDSSKPLAVARCLDLSWQLRKGNDHVVEQKATCDVDLVTPTGTGFEKMLSSSKNDSEILSEKDNFIEHDTGVPELTYTSTTLPSGDNIKTLEIVDACIYMVVPAWKSFTSFFQDLPGPSILDKDEIGSSIQVGDRWYKIGGGVVGQINTESQDKRKGRLSWIQSYTAEVITGNTKHTHRASTASLSSTFQLKVSLTWPRIIFTSIPVDGCVSRLVLRMNHLEYLNTNNGRANKVSRSFFLHDVEVYTLSTEKSKGRASESDNSLIHPCSFVGVVERCNGERLGDCEEHSVKISGDVLKARAAYSDMAIAIEVLRSALELNKEQKPTPSREHLISSSSFSASGSIDATPSSSAPNGSDYLYCKRPRKIVYDVECDGFELRVADDSGRHFAGTQDLITLSLGKLFFNREEFRNANCSMKLRLNSLDLFDCLQPENSPFRIAASSRSSAMGLQTFRNGTASPADVSVDGIQALSSRKMRRSDYIASKDGGWVFKIASALLERTRQASVACASAKLTKDESISTPELIEMTCLFTGKSSQDFKVKLGSFAVQWNPSTIIAIQRFLGRLWKESKIKADHVFEEQLDVLIAPPSIDSAEEGFVAITESTVSEDVVTIRATVEIESVTICLNKEHQNRRLLELTLASCRVELDSSEVGLSVHGQLGNLYAWDSDTYASKGPNDTGMMSRNRIVVQVQSSGRSGMQESARMSPSGDLAPFLEIRYQTFKKAHAGRVPSVEVPTWVQSHLSETGEIDDFLSLTVAALQFTYLRERTEELLDYLSNGLPGKGMGATSRAAKGFLTKRILTKSFLELNIDSPQVLIPQHETLLDAIALNLGDAKIRSWFEEAVPSHHYTKSQKPKSETEAEWWRVLSLGLTGFSGGVLREGALSTGLSSATNPIDLDIVLRKPTVRGKDMSMRGKLSFVELTWKYSDYVLLRAVACDNIGRKVDTEKWDNVEKAYWSEAAVPEDVSDVGIDIRDDSSSAWTDSGVNYSSNARFVRYGKRGRRRQKSAKNDSLDPSQSFPPSQNDTGGSGLDLRFELDGLSLKLRRDDVVEGVKAGDDLASAFHYDIVLMRVQLLEVSVTANGSGDLSFHLSLFRIGLFDLGDSGRLIRERYYLCLSSNDFASHRKKRKGLRQPCPFYVLAEGYSPGEATGKSTGKTKVNEEGPQFVVTVDRCPASSAGAIGSLANSDLPDDAKVTIARIVINYLSMNALIRPFKEIAAFFSCEWPTPIVRLAAHDTGADNTELDKTFEPASIQTVSQGFQLKLVAHYPRVFFLADESDPNSRALVLRGLAVVNLSKTTKANEEDVQRIISVDAQLHSMESFINPDVDEALGFKRRHAEMIGDLYSTFFPRMRDDDQIDSTDASNTLGVALIQPVTTGIEYCEVRRDLFPTKRSLFVNIEPVSTMLSFEDLQLIEAVLKRWSTARSGKSSSASDKEAHQANLVNGPVSQLAASKSFKREEWQEFDAVFRSQRLGLGLTMEADQVVVNSIQTTEHAGAIAIGDTVLAIDEENFEGRSLSDVVKRLSEGKRPITMRFRRLWSPHLAQKTEVEVEGPKNSERRSPEPRTPLVFKRKTKIEDESEFYVSSYTIRFHSDIPHGLELEKSPCGRFPIVTGVLPTYIVSTAACTIDESNADQIEATFETAGGAQPPRAGAVIVAVNENMIEELGLEEVWTLLSKLGNEKTGETAFRQNAGIGVIYSLSFKEIDSSLWGNIDAIDVSSSGIALSFIDDLHGKDMPLFRGKLNAVEVHAERGLGIEAHTLDTNIPSLLKLGSDAHNGQPRLTLLPEEIQDFNSECIVSFSGIARCSLDYFHPRIAYWEPLLEPSQLFLFCERQTGSIQSNRAGQLAVEVSDSRLHGQTFRGNFVPALTTEQQMVSCNLTDAAAEVFVKASGTWKEWRNGITNETDDEDDEPVEDGMVREAHSFPEQRLLNVVSAGATEVTIGPDILSSPENENIQRHREAQHIAAQKAAQAALNFAQKRGAETSKKGESAKPFVFRNRTGVSIAFAQQEVGKLSCRHSAGGHGKFQKGCNLSVVGEYAGLEDYDQDTIQELADQEDAKFSMEFVSDQSLEAADRDGLAKENRQPSNKVRNYEGRFPRLNIAIQAVSGVSVEPITDLQVSKVGSLVRHLVVRKDFDEVIPGERDSTQYSIPVVWKVEIEDNRRILTLSTAVRVVSTGYDTTIEVGVQKDVTPKEHLAGLTSIGFARPESPFYLPLWLALKLEPVSIFARPGQGETYAYRWGKSSVLHFGPLVEDQGAHMDPAEIGKWVWKETFEDLSYIRCDSVKEAADPVWLTVFGSGSSTRGRPGPVRHRQENNKASPSTPDFDEEFSEVISVTLDSSLTLRNMLPMSIVWEIGQAMEPSRSAVADGSEIRTETCDFDGSVGPQYFDGLLQRKLASLESGECTEVFACEFEGRHLQARFKEPDGRNWSKWASLSLEAAAETQHDADADGSDDTLRSSLPRARQVNIQVTNDSFGVPLTLGVRIVPKTTLQLLDDPSRARVYGLEVVIYAELWIRNITDLPLNFGCPSYQLHEGGEGYGISDESASRFTAESALMEIANLLEVGDKGTGLSNQAARDMAETGEIESLPNQECYELVEEVFEYIEIDSSTVKRRWWASESYASYRKNISDSSQSTGAWRWVDENWAIDCVGEAKASIGGWESCRNLLAGAGSFSGKRNFDPGHGVRRRRYFRRRTGRHVRRTSGRYTETPAYAATQGLLLGGLQAFHQPLKDSFSREQRKLRRKNKIKHGKVKGDGHDRDGNDDDALTKVAIKCGDGKWSLPANVADAGTSHGVVRVLASRWPSLTRGGPSATKDALGDLTPTTVSERGSPHKYGAACLDSDLFELCYTVSDAEGEWGEFSRAMTVSSRFLLRNDSKRFTMEIKQAGAPDSSSLKLAPGEVQPFYWKDFRLPGLVSVHPSIRNEFGRDVYGWSGGFDLCRLGMIPIRIRSDRSHNNNPSNLPLIRSIRALVEIRPGTGGSGINISFKEEDPSGDGSLFRVENSSTFPIWLSQDGVLANPSAASKPKQYGSAGPQQIEGGYSEIDGDLVQPSESSSFALDVPYRQGKYAHRKEATMVELLRVRISLAPLASRAGIETVKVIGLTTVGETVRLNPSKLIGVLTPEMRESLQRVRILGVITSDGPTRVLKLCLMAYPASDSVFSNPFGDVSYASSKQQRRNQSVMATSRQDFTKEIRSGGTDAVGKLKSGILLGEQDAKQRAIFEALEKAAKGASEIRTPDGEAQLDQIFSFRAEFSGFIFSLVDSSPSEIAVASLRNFNALARWNALRSTEASLIVSVGWLQVDNHVPSAPFKVAVRPGGVQHSDDDDSSVHPDFSYKVESASSPLLMLAVAFAPKHKSGIVCLRSVTVAPRNLVIAVDLAFLVRLQRFFVGLRCHFQNRHSGDIGGLRTGSAVLYTEQKRCIAFPEFDSPAIELKRAAAFGTENQKLYFQGLTILPCNITLSVAPARALTATQAGLEGKETAAIHVAVRKGDVLVGSSSALLGVRVGRKNTTPLAVVRGVFKSIVVDALLRLDGASLNFSGVFLRNHISTGPQLTTLLLAHYLSSLRHNVPALLGSLAAFGNPLGLIRGLGDGVSDFVSEPVKGLKKSVKELDPTFLVDGVARGTESLARHTVGGFADSASLLTETFSKNMAVLTLDRRYAQKRDRGRSLRLNAGTTVTLAGGVESGFVKLVQGFMDGVTGVVKAPIRGAEKRGIEGFAKGIGKGLLGLLVKPMIGISDAATDVMIGVKNTVENNEIQRQNLALTRNQFRPRRPMYGRDKVLRPYRLADAAASTLMLNTRCAGENYLSHIDMGDRVALLSVRRLILIGPNGQELLALKHSHVSKLEVRAIKQADGSDGWGIIVVLNTPRRNGSEVEVITCQSRQEAVELCSHIQRGRDLIASGAL